MRKKIGTRRTIWDEEEWEEETWDEPPVSGAGIWRVSLGAPYVMHPEDVELWLRHDFPLAHSKAYPVGPAGTTPGPSWPSTAKGTPPRRAAT